jgi:Imidazolonepropionase and related amidohydrolases
MMAKRRLSPAPLLLCLGLWLASAPFLASEESLHEVWAVKDCRVVTPGGPVLPKATVIIRGGLIESVGAETAIPPDAEVIDGSALTLHPGLIDGLGQSLLKLPEEKFDPAKFYSGEFTDKDRGLTPELRAFDFAVLGKATLEKHHKFGLTAVQAIPSKGVLSGQASLFSLSSEDKNKALAQGHLARPGLFPRFLHGLSELAYGSGGLLSPGIRRHRALRPERGSLGEDAPGPPPASL